MHPVVTEEKQTALKKSQGESDLSTDNDDQFACSECNFYGKGQNELNEHQRTHDLPRVVDPVIYHCGKCENKYDVFDELAKHIDEQHSNNDQLKKDGSTQQIEDEVYICGECCLRFSTYIQCESHTETHGLRCYKCDFTTKDSQNLKVHEENMHESFKWENSQMKTSEDLTEKVPTTEEPNTKHKEMQPDNVNEEETLQKPRDGVRSQTNVEIENATFYCRICGYNFEEFELFVKHSIEKHGEAPGIKCNKCDRGFPDKGMLTKHLEEEHSYVNYSSSTQKTDEVKIQRCCFCDFETPDGIELNNHEVDKHGMINCEKCDYSALEESIMEKHKKQHTGGFLLQCGQCEFEARKQATLEAHHESKHLTTQETKAVKYRCEKCEIDFDDFFIFKSHICIVTSKYQCEQCSFTAVTLVELLSHMESEHAGYLQEHLSQMRKPKATTTESSKIKCDQCAFIAEDIPAMISHIRKGHGKLGCNYCEQTAETSEQHKNHMCEIHPEIVLIHSMAQQMDTVLVNFAAFETFKSELGNVMKTVLENQKSIKQELSDRCSKLEKVVDQLSKKKVEESAPNDNEVPKDAPKIKEKKRKQKGAKHRVTWVGTSVSKSLDTNKFENDTNTELTMVKSYCVNKEGRFPDSNFKVTVPAVVKKEDADTIVLETGSIEITNMDVNNAMVDPTKDIKEYQKEWFEKAEEVSTELFKIAEDAIAADENVNVIILKRLPRFDRSSSDISKIKAKISEFANQVYDQLWLRRGSPERIHIVSIKLLEKEGFLKDIIYGSHEDKKYDGIHLVGSGASRHFTYRAVQAILPILSKPNQDQKSSSFSRGKRNIGYRQPDKENHINCPQAKFKRQSANGGQGGRSDRLFSDVVKGPSKQKVKNSYTVPTSNFFNPLNY